MEEEEGVGELGGSGAASATFDEPPLVSTASGALGSRRLHANSHAGPKLRIVRLFAPEAVQNGTQNVTIGECALLASWRAAELPNC